MSTSENQKLYFMAGRANPPTPGHITLMATLIQLAEAQQPPAIPKIYITQTVNDPSRPEIQYVVSDESLKNGTRQDEARKNYVDVKNRKYQNPLTPEVKKYLIVQMLINKLGVDPNDHVRKAQIEGYVENKPTCNGTWRAMMCALAAQREAAEQLPTEEEDLKKRNNNVFYFMGEELDAKEKQGREKYCSEIDRLVLNDGEYVLSEKEHNDDDSGIKVPCITLKRTKDETAAGMSGSKIRLLVCGKNTVEMDENTRRNYFDAVYGSLLNSQDKKFLFDAIKEGVLGRSSLKRSSEPDFETQGPQKEGRTSADQGGRKTRRKRKYKRKTRKNIKRKKTGRKKTGRKKTVRKKTVRKKCQSKHKKKKNNRVKKRTRKRHRGGKNEPRDACISYADIFEWHPSDITVGETLLLQHGDGPNAPSHLRPLEVKVHELHTAGTNDESRRQQRPRVVVIPVIDLEKPPRQQRKMKLYAEYLMPVRHKNVEGREETGEGKYKLCRM